MIDCLKCGKKCNNANQRWMCVPGYIMVPSEYYLCNEHKDIRYSFEDIYDVDGSRKKNVT